MTILTTNKEIVDQTMGMTIPTIQTPGQKYAVDITDALLNHIAPHRHTGLNNLDGYQLDSPSINITKNLTFNGVSAIDLSTVRLQNQTSIFVGSQDIGCLFEVDGELYYNDATGAHVQITNNGALNIEAYQATTTFNILACTSNYGISPTDIYTMFYCDSTHTALQITLPLSSTVNNGRFYYFTDKGFNAATNRVRIATQSSSGDLISDNGFEATTTGQSYIDIIDNGATILLWTDQSGTWYSARMSKLTFQGPSQSVNINSTAQGSGSLSLSSSNLNLFNSSNLNITNSSQTNNNSSILFNGTTNSVGGYLNLNSNLTISNNNLPYRISLDCLLEDNNIILVDNNGRIQINNGNTSGPYSSSSLGLSANAQGSITANANGSIIGTIAGAIQPFVAAGIESNVTSGISSIIASGIQSNCVGGINLNGGITDWITYSQPRSFTKTYPIINSSSQIPTVTSSSTPSVTYAANGWYAVTNSSHFTGMQNSQINNSIPLVITLPDPPYNYSTITQVIVAMQVLASYPASSRSPRVSLCTNQFAQGSAPINSVLASHTETDIDMTNTSTIQYITLIVDVSINTSNQVYTLEIYDGINIGNTYYSYTITYSNIVNNQLA